jgi:3'-5' exoribonuclease
MRYINELRENDTNSEIYFCKKADALVTKAGKTYYSVTLQDKTGTIEGKVWDVTNPGIEEFDKGDYVMVGGRITSYMGNLQYNIDRIYRVQEGQYNVADYMPCSEYDTDAMYEELLEILKGVKEVHLRKLIKMFFVDDEAFVKAFKAHSAAKTVHHGFIGGLLEHTLHVTKLCQFYGTLYKELNMDLLLTAAAFHDIGKLDELSTFPENDYTDNGQLLGHIVIGIVKLDKAMDTIGDFPPVLRGELEHLIASHHGELEYGSPKKPALMEAMALHHADNTDAKLETFKELVSGAVNTDWMGYNRFVESNVRKTTEW